MKRRRDSSSSDDSFSSEDEKDLISKISTMMYTFGDVKKPLDESVELMYIILREQMNLLLKEALEAAELRGSNEISHREILFVMRKNKAVLTQLLQYLQVLDTKPWLAVDEKFNEDPIQKKMKRVKMCKDFFASIEDCKEFTSLLEDDTLTLPKHVRKRLERRLTVIEHMKQNEYEEFSKALQVSFCQKSMEKFKKWLLQKKVTEIPLTQLALIIIGFLARETIAEVVDKVLLIKNNKLGMQNCNCSSEQINLLDASYNKRKSRLIESKQYKVTDLKLLTNISKMEVNIISCINSNNNATESENDLTFSNALNEDSASKKDVSSDISSSDESENLEREFKDEKLKKVSSVDVIDSKDEKLQKVSSLDVTYSKDEKSFEENSNDIFMDSWQYDKVSVSSVSKPSSEENIWVTVEESNSGRSDLASPSSEISDAQGAFSSNFPKVEDISSDEDSSGFPKSSTSKNLDNISSVDKCQENLNKITKNLTSSEKLKPLTPPLHTTSIKKDDCLTSCGSKKESKEEFLDRKPITPEEIREAFCHFNDPSPLIYFLSNYPVHPKKKFILAGSFKDL